MLKKCKEKFKAGLLTSAEDFKKSVAYLEDEFQLRGPYSANTHVTDALSATEAFANQVNVLKDQEASIRRGLNIFKIEQQNSKSLQSIEKDISYLEQVICK